VIAQCYVFCEENTYSFTRVHTHSYGTLGLFVQQKNLNFKYSELDSDLNVI
jgi:hypothetical protein